MEGLKLMIENLVKAVKELNEAKVLDLVKYHLNEGVKPITIIEDIQKGMINVGDMFQRGDYYLADLIMAGIIFKEVLELDEMKLFLNIEAPKNEKKPLILLGTIKDDIHDIGKEIFSGMASANGFEIIDLGVDVSPEKFIEMYLKLKPDIIAISGILIRSTHYMKQVVDLLIKIGEREKIKIIVGGHPIDKNVSDYIGADGYSKDVKEGIELCKKWINEKNEVHESE